jgi:hypothetical protein
MTVPTCAFVVAIPDIGGFPLAGTTAMHRAKATMALIDKAVRTLDLTDFLGVAAILRASLNYPSKGISVFCGSLKAQLCQLAFVHICQIGIIAL